MSFVGKTNLFCTSLEAIVSSYQYLKCNIKAGHNTFRIDSLFDSQRGYIWKQGKHQKIRRAGSEWNIKKNLLKSKYFTNSAFIDWLNASRFYTCFQSLLNDENKPQPTPLKASSNLQALLLVYIGLIMGLSCLQRAFIISVRICNFRGQINRVLCSLRI